MDHDDNSLSDTASLSLPSDSGHSNIVLDKKTFQENISVAEFSFEKKKYKHVKHELKKAKRRLREVESDNHQLKDQIKLLSDEISSLKQVTQTQSGEISQEDDETKLSRLERLYTKAMSYNEDLREQIKTLSSELHWYHKNPDICSHEISTQTDSISTEELIEDQNSSIETSCNQQNNSDGLVDENLTTISSEIAESQSIADSLRDAAQEASNATGFVYDPNTGMYYDHNSGYYYDSERQLYYESKTGTYYKFNYDTNSYEVHSQVDYLSYYLQQHAAAKIEQKKEEGLQEFRQRRIQNQMNALKTELNIGGKRKHNSTHQKDSERKRAPDKTNYIETNSNSRPVSTDDTLINNHNSEEIPEGSKTKTDSGVSSEAANISDPEEGQLSDSSVDLSSDSDESQSINEFSFDEDSDPLNLPPCIRAMVTESDTIDIGSLFIITCRGASLGRQKDANVSIPDSQISKIHVKFLYNSDLKQYEITDQASQNGTFLNGRRIGQAKVVSEPAAVYHNDMIQVGGTKLTLHIHPGTNTCDSCEPGVVIAEMKKQEQQEETSAQAPLTASQKEHQRRKHLKQIKKKFGLEKMAYERGENELNPAYQDKAAVRRRTVGSEAPCQQETADPASVHREISSENKGRKMLQKMGWKHGESLGKPSSDGIKEPVQINIRSKSTAGLGSGQSFERSMDKGGESNNIEKWLKAKDRYEQLEQQQSKHLTQQIDQSKNPTDNLDAI